MARSDPRIRGVALSEVLQGQVQKAVSTRVCADHARDRRERSLADDSARWAELMGPAVERVDQRWGELQCLTSKAPY